MAAALGIWLSLPSLLLAPPALPFYFLGLIPEAVRCQWTTLPWRAEVCKEETDTC